MTKLILDHHSPERANASSGMSKTRHFLCRQLIELFEQNKYALAFDFTDHSLRYGLINREGEEIHHILELDAYHPLGPILADVIQASGLPNCLSAFCPFSKNHIIPFDVIFEGDLIVMECHIINFDISSITRLVFIRGNATSKALLDLNVMEYPGVVKHSYDIPPQPEK